MSIDAIGYINYNTNTAYPAADDLIEREKGTNINDITGPIFFTHDGPMGGLQNSFVIDVSGDLPPGLNLANNLPAAVPRYWFAGVPSQIGDWVFWLRATRSDYNGYVISDPFTIRIYS